MLNLKNKKNSEMDRIKREIMLQCDTARAPLSEERRLWMLRAHQDRMDQLVSRRRWSFYFVMALLCVPWFYAHLIQPFIGLFVVAFTMGMGSYFNADRDIDRLIDLAIPGLISLVKDNVCDDLTAMAMQSELVKRRLRAILEARERPMVFEYEYLADMLRSEKHINGCRALHQVVFSEN